MAIAPKPCPNLSMLAVPEAADLLGIGRTLPYDLVRRGQRGRRLDCGQPTVEHEALCCHEARPV